MSVVKLLDRYLPNVVPRETSDQMREYLRDELDFIASAVNGSLEIIDALNSIPRMFLLGDADDFLLDTSDSTIVNYDQAGALGNVLIEPDRILGTITIPVTGAYRVSAFIIGVQGNQVQNVSIVLSIGVNAVLVPIASIDVATNQTSIRSLSATLTRGFTVGDELIMSMFATGDLGLFLISQVSFEVVLVALPTELQDAPGEAFITDMSFGPWIVTPTTPGP